MMRIGNGYDVHRLIEGRRLIIDAMLGAAAPGDIGKIFPDNDPSIKDIDSGLMLRRVNVDSIVVAQRPKLAPHIQSMRRRIAELLELNGRGRRNSGGIDGRRGR